MADLYMTFEILASDLRWLGVSMALSLAASGTLSSQFSIFCTSPSVLTLWKPRYEKMAFCGSVLLVSLNSLKDKIWEQNQAKAKENQHNHISFLMVILSPKMYHCPKICSLRENKGIKWKMSDTGRSLATVYTRRFD